MTFFKDYRTTESDGTKEFTLNFAVEDHDTGEWKTIEDFDLVFDRSVAESWTRDEFRAAMIRALTDEDVLTY